MDELTFKPAGVAFAALVSGLASVPAPLAADAPGQVTAAQAEAEAASALEEAIASFEPMEPFILSDSEEPAYSDIPLGD